MKHFNQLFHKNIIQKITIYGSVITLTGADGTADITINDIPNKVSATFLTDLTTTAHNWVTANIEHYEYYGYSVSAASGVITVVPKSDWDTVNRINATISNLTEDLSGTLTGVFEPDFSKADIWEATFTMNSTIANPRNPRDGDKMDLILVGTGSYTLSWGDAWVSDNSLTSIDTDIVTIKVRQVDGLSYAKSSFSWWTPGIPRNNIIGQIAVTKDVYDTNSGVTTYTVGASGADYTTLADAYAAASAGDVIEIIDDNITLADRLIINKGVDLQGKAIKIKGKTTKSTITLAVNAISIISIGNGTSIEFENIIFTEPSHTSSYPFFNNTDNVTGFTHFINCVFVDCTGSLYLYNAHEVIYDGGSLSVPFNCVYDNDFVENGSKFIVNNVQYSTSAGEVAFVYIEGSSTAKKYGYVSVTNSDITTNYSCIRGTNTVKQWRVEGNLLHSVSDMAFITGLEASGAAISTVSAWNESTTYIVGSLINYRCILYECLIENTDSAPDRDVNLSWRRARLITGVFRNNTLFRTTYVATGHGCFFGYGCYDFIIENNIVDNYCYNIVVKGHNNIIRFNGIGRGLAPGIAFFSNDQAEVRNNTIRTEGTAITYGPNTDDTEGLISTTFMDNIISSSISGNIINDTFSRWVNPPTIQNNFYRNRYFGESATAVINGGTSRVLSDSSGFTGWKEDSGETGEYNDPDFIGSNSALKDYYTPGNIEYLKYKDSNGQSIGAVDLFAL